MSTFKVSDNLQEFGEKMNYRPGYNLGISSEFKFNSLLSLETGIMMSKKGAALSIYDEFPMGSEEYKERYDLTYVELPLALKVSRDVKKLRIHGFAGGYFAVGVKSKLTVRNKITYDNETHVSEQTEEGLFKPENEFIKPIDFGTNFGMGVEYKKVLLEFSYSRGFSNLIYDEPSFGDEFSVNNSVFSLNFGYRIFQKI